MLSQKKHRQHLTVLTELRVRLETTDLTETQIKPSIYGTCAHFYPGIICL